MIYLVMYLFTVGDPQPPPLVVPLAAFVMEDTESVDAPHASGEQMAKWACEQELDFVKTQQPGHDKWAVYACVPERGT